VQKTVNEYKAARTAFARRLLAEFLGSTILVFVIAGLKIRANQPQKFTDALGATLGSGLCLSGLIYCFGSICGAHFNAAVTFALFLRRSFPGRWLILYWIVQFAGSLLAAGLLRSLFGSVNGRYGSNYPDEGDGWHQTSALWAEVLFSAIFLFVILMLSKKGGVAGADAALGVGFTLFWVLLFLASVTYCARTL
jgi:glycerol uptake facilitator-like aquaporin